MISGSNLNAVVNYCIYADPNNTDCKSKGESDIYIAKLSFRHKFVTQYFNPSYYDSNNKMEYRSVYDQYYDLVEGTSTNYNYYGIQNQVSFAQGKFADFSNFVFLQFASNLIYYNIQLEGYVQFTGGSNNTEQGITSISTVQGS